MFFSSFISLLKRTGDNLFIRQNLKLEYKVNSGILKFNIGIIPKQFKIDNITIVFSFEFDFELNNNIFLISKYKQSNNFIIFSIIILSKKKYFEYEEKINKEIILPISIILIK